MQKKYPRRELKNASVLGIVEPLLVHGVGTRAFFIFGFLVPDWTRKK